MALTRTELPLERDTILSDLAMSPWGCVALGGHLDPEAQTLEVQASEVVPASGWAQALGGALEALAAALHQTPFLTLEATTLFDSWDRQLALFFVIFSLGMTGHPNCCSFPISFGVSL